MAGKKKSEGSKGKKGGAGGKLVTIVKKIGKKGGTVTKVIRTPGDKKWKHDKFEATQVSTRKTRLDNYQEHFPTDFR